MGKHRQKKNGHKKSQPRRKLSKLEKILLLTAILNFITAIINAANTIASKVL